VSHHVSEPSQSGLVAAFFPGDFKPLGNKSTKATTPEASAKEMHNVNPEESNKVAGVYSCPQDGCVRIFQQVSALQNHLSLEKCTRSPGRHTVTDLAKMGYKSALEEGVGVLPTLKPQRFPRITLLQLPRRDGL